MKFSKRTATALGTLIADKLHACESIDARQGVIDVFFAIQDALAVEEYQTYRALTDAFRARIKELEPL
jgi:hypothetical protein